MKIVIAVILLAGMVALGHADTDEDAQALRGSEQRWGAAAYTLELQTAHGPVYAVGFYSIFGSPIVVGSGASWKDAFASADAARARPIPPPVGGQW